MSDIKISLYSIVILLVVAVGCGSNSETTKQSPPPVPVTLQEVNYTYAPYSDEYPAIVKALEEVELRPQVNGYITGIYFKEGEQVKKGQKLYSIDQQAFQAAYEQAAANVAVQEANLEKARKDVERYRELDKQDAIAKQQLDYAEATFVSAQQQLQAAKAAVSSVQTNVRYTTITAPFDGTIGISQVRLGASVSPGQTLLNTISSDDPMAVDVTVDQGDVYMFAKMLKEKKIDGDSTFRLELNGIRYPYFGELSLIDRAVDPQTGTIKMRVIFPNPEHTLRAGMSASLSVLTNTTEKSVTIPFKAVTEQLGEFFVYVSNGNTVTQRKVTLGKQVRNDIIIRDGLRPGETIVVQGVQNLREGAVISVSDPAVPKK